MRIARIKLYALELEPLRRFYRDTLELPLCEDGEGSFTVRAGQSLLTFDQGLPDSDSSSSSDEPPYYHFAFNISENKIAEAVEWLERKGVAISPVNGRTVVRSESWDSDSVYFVDPAGNIVEFIARHGLSNGADTPGFSAENIVNISEIGCGTDDVNELSGLLRKRLRGSVYLEGDDLFTPIGDEEGLIILSSLRRNWLGSNKPVRIFPMEITVLMGETGESQVLRFPYPVRTLSFRKRTNEDAIPYDLLLLADPSREMVDDYVGRGDCYLAYADGELVGEFVLVATHPRTLEIVNIAVRESWQGQGIGKALVLKAIETARASGAAALEIGTANSSFDQLRLYQRCGFRMVGVDADFFVRHYPEPIYENGLRATDMVRLRIELR